MALFEWDERKRLENLKKHNIDFLDAFILFECPYVEGLANIVNNEQRHLATGILNERYVTAVFVYRGDAIRIISIRSARRGERAKYQALYGE